MCEKVLKVLNKVLEKYNTLSVKERSAKKLWQRVRFGNGELADTRDLREKLTYYTSALSLFVNMVSTGSIGRVEEQMENAGGDIREIRIAVNGTTAHLLSASNREGSVLTTYADDDKAVWKEFRKELIEEGFSSSIIGKHKRLIKAYIKELGDRGLLDDEDPHDIKELSEEDDTNTDKYAREAERAVEVIQRDQRTRRRDKDRRRDVESKARSKFESFVKSFVEDDSSDSKVDRVQEEGKKSRAYEDEEEDNRRMRDRREREIERAAESIQRDQRARRDRRRDVESKPRSKFESFVESLMEDDGSEPQVDNRYHSESKRGLPSTKPPYSSKRDPLDYFQYRSQYDPAAFKMINLPKYGHAEMLPDIDQRHAYYTPESSPKPFLEPIGHREKPLSPSSGNREYLAVPPGDCLTVGDCEFLLLLERFQARFQILLECLPDICIFRVREDIDEIEIYMAQTIGILKDFQMVADFARSASDILSEFNGCPTIAFADSVFLGFLWYSEGHHSKRALWTNLEAFKSSGWLFKSEGLPEEVSAMREWTRRFDIECSATARRLTNTWAEAAKLISNSTYSDMKSLALSFAEEKVSSESQAQVQEGLETLQPVTPLSSDPAGISTHPHMSDYDGGLTCRDSGNERIRGVAEEDLNRKTSPPKNDRHKVSYTEMGDSSHAGHKRSPSQ